MPLRTASHLHLTGPVFIPAGICSLPTLSHSVLLLPPGHSHFECDYLSCAQPELNHYRVGVGVPVLLQSLSWRTPENHLAQMISAHPLCLSRAVSTRPLQSVRSPFSIERLASFHLLSGAPLISTFSSSIQANVRIRAPHRSTCFVSSLSSGALRHGFLQGQT